MRVHLKVAYGTFGHPINVNLGWSLRRITRHIEEEIRNCFPISRSESVEVVLNRYTPFSELGEKIPDLNISGREYLMREQFNDLDCTFYTRIIRKIGQDEFIKCDRDSYMKKTELEELREGLRNNNEIAILNSDNLNMFVNPNPEPEICLICTETQVNHQPMYRCNHLFCGPCFTRWNNTNHTCALCRQPVR